jgi:predicted GH43/DUF377 family glycosyl hydrolase
VGSRSELFLYEGQKHGFFNHPDFRPNASPDCFQETMLETERFLVSLGFLPSARDASGEALSDFRFSPAEGLGPREAVMRRDPSDVIKVEELFYVWYSRGPQAHGYNATVWYATSPDGRQWTEKGEALARGPQGSWDEQSVFTPNILVAENKYWLFYTAVRKPFVNTGPKITKTAIGVAVADSPVGPWRKLDRNPVLTASDDPNQFDSMRVDDACLIVRGGKYLLYFKGRQWDNTPGNTKMADSGTIRPATPRWESLSPTTLTART